MQNQAIMLEVVYDPNTGSSGLLACDSVWNLKDTDAPMINDGALLAHDIMEHVNGLSNIGGVGEECEALGALFQVRGWSGSLQAHGAANRNIHTVEQNLSSDLVQMYSTWEQKDFEAIVPDTSEDTDIEAELEEVFAQASTDIRKEYPQEDYEEATPENLERYLKGCIEFMRVGYRKAEDKYPCRLEAYDTFFAIAKATDEAITFFGLDDQGFEGRKFELTVSSCRATIVEEEESWDE